MSANDLPAGRAESSPLKRALSFLAGRKASASPMQHSLEAAPLNFAHGMPLLDFCRPGFYHWGGVNLPIEYAVRPFAITGEQGSGKSSFIKLLLLSAVQNIAHGYGKRLFLTDFKGEYLQVLARYLRPGTFMYVEPFDLRGARWRMFPAFKNPEDAEEFGRLIAPTNEHGREPFFEDAAGNLTAGLAAGVFISRGEDGDLSDITYYAQSPDLILEGLSLAPDWNRARIGLYFNSKRPNRDVLATLGNKLGPLAAAAAAWQGARDTFTIPDWASGRCALVLGYSHLHPEATKALGRALVGSLHRTILSDRNCNTPKTWMFLDELPFYGRMDSLPGVLSLGRAKGLAAVIAYQDRGLMLEVYGPNFTQAISALTPQKGFCRCSDPETAEWISRHFGETDRTRYTLGTSQAPGQPPTLSINQQFDRPRVLRPEDIMQMSIASSDDDHLSAFFISPVLGMSYPCTLPIAMLRRLLPQDVDDGDDDFENYGLVPAVPVRPAPPPLKVYRDLPSPSPSESSTSDNDDTLPYWR